VSDDAIKHVLDRLVGSLDYETGDWEGVLEHAGEPSHPGEGSRGGRRRWLRRERRLPLLAGAVVAAALATVTIISPWQRAPSLLDRAAAAIVSPAANQVLHERFVIRERAPCTIPRTPPTPARLGHLRLCSFTGRGAIWLDGGPSHRFRVVVVDPAGRVGETGGSIGAARGLAYQPLEDVLDPVVFDCRTSRSDLDPVAFAGAALVSGRAQLDGSATIRGQKVLRIRVTAHRFGHDVTDALYFVDPHTYRPVRIVFTPGYKPFLRGLPLIGLPGACGSGATLLSPLVFDFVRYRYLPPTPENRKLANIRAEHPHAKIL
jgi:hypothetical protein